MALVILIRELGPNWRVITFTVVLYELILHSTPSSSCNIANVLLTNILEVDQVLATYLKFLERIYHLNVQDVYEVKRLIPVSPHPSYCPNDAG
jgi:hypothetical protein